MNIFTKVYCSLLLLLGVASVNRAFQSPARKTWWAKRVLSDDYYTAGRLSVRQIKYTSESTFKSIVSLFSYDTDDGEDPTNQGAILPSTAKAEAVASLAGIEYTSVGLNSKSWKTTDALDALSEALSNVSKPVLVHDDTAFASTFLLLLHFARTSRRNPEFRPRINAEQLFSVGAGLGFDFSAESLVLLVEDVTGETAWTIEQPDLSLPDWYIHYWPAKPLGNKWFIAGQIQSNDLSRIQDAGFKTLINYRTGKVTAGSPSQEEVTLLNIKDRTGTYEGEGRQRKNELEKNRIDPKKPNTYISPNSTINYETRNPLEYGDDIGYSEELEKSQIPSDLEYIHLPIGGEYTYTKSMWDEYGPKHQRAGADGAPVLAHCRTGFRSAVVAIIQVALTDGVNSTLALNRLKEVGYDITTKAPSALSLYIDVLDTQRDYGRNKGVATPRCAFNWFVFASLSALLLII